MDPVGISLGLVSLTFQIFSGCVTAYQLLSEARGLAKEYQYLRVRVKTEQCRLLDWATVTKLTERDETLAIDRYSKNIIIDVLDQQRRLLMQFGRLDGRLQPLVNPLIAEELETQSRDRQIRDVSESEEEFCNRFPHSGDLLEKCTKFIAQTSKFPAKLRWAMSDKKSLEELLGKLSGLNNYLVELLNTQQMEMLLTRQMRTDFMIIQLNDKLNHLQEIAEAGLAVHLTKDSNEGHQMVMRGGYDRVQGLYSDSDQSRHLTGLAQFKALGSAMEMDTLTDEFAQRLELGKSVEDITSCEIPVTSIKLLTHHSSIDDDHRTDAWYISRLGRDRHVWIEWKPGEVKGAPGVGQGHKIISRLDALVALLRENTRTQQFTAVPCLGYIRHNTNKEDASFRFGLVFENPTGVAPSTKPVSLSQLLQDRKKRVPSLTTRFALARAIVECVEKLHAVNWLHKGLRSENLLFFDAVEGNRDLSKPYLSGFDYSRPAQRNDMTERPTGDVLHDLYRHPQVQGLSRDTAQGKSYKKRHDIYSLGIILLEISYWDTIESILGFKEVEEIRPSETAMMRGKLLSGRYLDYVQSNMGDNLYGVIQSCLQGVTAFGISEEADEMDVFVGAKLQAKFYELITKNLQEIKV
ncbi:uncharacterized protein PAC_19177 [Phialocephala subalpina]|uniref:Protein kinase domain-containing protein n=1 Tax=Phialocephala subalpina TaxID=576137 RepID=A0A1L7XW95_9HELO|nr:uncharacterized protein PAC_19177 [Phialocephala subalpina]